MPVDITVVILAQILALHLLVLLPAQVQVRLLEMLVVVLGVEIRGVAVEKVAVAWGVLGREIPALAVEQVAAAWGVLPEAVT
jgi:hypothetical protein